MLPIINIHLFLSNFRICTI